MAVLAFTQYAKDSYLDVQEAFKLPTVTRDLFDIEYSISDPSWMSPFLIYHTGLRVRVNAVFYGIVFFALPLALWQLLPWWLKVSHWSQSMINMVDHCWAGSR